MHAVLIKFQIADELETLRDRLERDDPTLTVFEPWKETSLFFSMEEPHLKGALYSCLDASANASCIQRAVLRNLPEPELEYALTCLSRNPHITQIHINDDTKSHSIQASAVIKFLDSRQRLQGTGKGLQKLHISTRVVVSNNCHVRDLAQAMELTSLQSVTLHILPRCPIRAPTISVDPITTCLARLPRLKCLQIVLGYQHNPYGSPMMSVPSCHALFSKPLLKLRLTNCGLNTEHLRPLGRVLSDPENKLISLQLDLNPVVPGRDEILQSIVDALATRNTTLKRFAWDTQLLVSPCGEDDENCLRLLQQAQMWCRYNRCGRKALRRCSETAEYPSALLATLARAAENHGNVDVSYTILRSHPALFQGPKPAPKRQLSRRSVIETRILRRLQTSCSSHGYWSGHSKKPPLSIRKTGYSSHHRDHSILLPQRSIAPPVVGRQPLCRFSTF